MKRFLCLLTTMLLLMMGCSPTFKVYDADKADLKGIPFYTYATNIKQDTVYSRSWIVATLVYHTLKDDEPVPESKRVAEYMIDASTYDSSSLADAHKASTDILSLGYNKAFDAFKTELVSLCKDKVLNCLIPPSTMVSELDAATKIPVMLEQQLVSNSSMRVDYIDYSSPRYINTDTPWFGKTDGTIKVNEKGLLTEAVSKPDNTKLLELVPDIFPIKDKLIDRWGLKEEPAAAVDTDAEKMMIPQLMSILDDSAKPAMSLILETKSANQLFTLTKYHKLSDGSLNNSPILFDDVKASIAQKSATSATAEKPIKDEDKKAYKLSATITPPES